MTHYTITKKRLPAAMALTRRLSSFGVPESILCEAVPDAVATGLCIVVDESRQRVLMAELTDTWRNTLDRLWVEDGWEER